MALLRHLFNNQNECCRAGCRRDRRSCRNDGSVRRGAMEALARYYEHYVNPGNVNSGNLFYQTDNHAPHALVINDYGGVCFGL